MTPRHREFDCVWEGIVEILDGLEERYQAGGDNHGLSLTQPDTWTTALLDAPDARFCGHAERHVGFLAGVFSDPGYEVPVACGVVVERLLLVPST